MTVRRALAATLAAASLLLVSACGDDDAGSDTSQGADQTAAHNGADVAFAQQMIPHHEQAVQMSDMVLASKPSPEVRRLAEQIRQAQEPEIDQMAQWLQAWGEDLPAGGMDHDAMGHGDGAMPGMMTAEQMQGLEEARGRQADQMFLTMMIEHHEGAVEMAEEVRAEGSDPEVAELAEQVADTQTAEIERMEQLLGR